MLRAMKEQLKYLAQDEDKKFHLTLRERVGKRATDILESKLKKIIILMPDLVEKMYSYWQNEKTNSKMKKLGSYLLTYLYLPKNFIPQKEWGLFGYLDDAYFVAKMYTTVIEEIQLAGGKIKVSDIPLYDEVKMLKKDVRIVIPKECSQIDEMILELSEDKKEAFFGLMNKND